MRKSKDITKYEVEWQILRADVKGKRASLDEKLERARSYFNKTNSYDRWERVVNWLEGVIMGYKSAKDYDSIHKVLNEIDYYKSIKGEVNDAISYDVAESAYSDLKEYSYELRLMLWRNLYQRNKVWLSRGYFHKDINIFMDYMVELFNHKKEKFPNFDKLMLLREECKTKDNVHKFFF